MLGGHVLNLTLITQRLSQYAAVWVGAFLVTLIGIMGARYGFGLDLIDVADVVLPCAFAVLALLTLTFLIITLLDRQTLATHIVLILLGAFLALPLLWSPVLATLVAAWIARVSIEYSAAYAQFRITISHVVYPATQFLFGPAVSTAWNVFQGLATVVGFFAALGQIWTVARRFLVSPTPATHHETA
jgi:hypothetical protein